MSDRIEIDSKHATRGRIGARIVNRTAAALAVALAAAGCGASTPTGVETLWLRADGSVASEGEISAARGACEATVQARDTVASKRRDYMQWAGRMVECMERHDLYLVQREDG